MIKEYFTKIASFGPIGDSVLGKIIASVLALPAIMFLNFIDERTPTCFWILVFAVLLISIFAILFSQKDSENRIIINSFIGTMLAFYGIAFNVKLGLIGLALFHVFSFALPFFVFTKSKDLEEQEHSKFVRIIVISLAAGFTVNVFLRFVLWIVK
ncbi:MAG: hypothetical protein US49_C0001G0131 [candidate division TM6 bacterium GW2011_GWF2_37_49]|nr:MAG: hypothetical protein US49_C0001G0131 [candidate division TM6 bacterium GW2011_GWF2_37_49]